MESREMDSPRQDLIEGRNAIREALRAERPIDKIYVNRGSDDPALGRIIRDARAADIPVVEVDRRKLDEMSVTRSHQGVIGVAAAAAYSDIDGIFALAEERGEPPFIVCSKCFCGLSSMPSFAWYFVPEALSAPPQTLVEPPK